MALGLGEYTRRLVGLVVDSAARGGLEKGKIEDEIEDEDEEEDADDGSPAARQSGAASRAVR